VPGHYFGHVLGLCLRGMTYLGTKRPTFFAFQLHCSSVGVMVSACRALCGRYRTFGGAKHILQRARPELYDLGRRRGFFEREGLFDLTDQRRTAVTRGFGFVAATCSSCGSNS